MSSLPVPGPLVTVDWLAERLGHTDLVVLDASVGARRELSDRLGQASTQLVDRQHAAGGPCERLIFSCGSGVTACNLALAAHLAGHRDLAVYDGSWSEWGLPSELPVVTGK